MANFSLHHQWLAAMPLYQHAVGIGTQAFSAIAFYLMIKKTPRRAKQFAKFLMFMQANSRTLFRASITLTDFNFGFLEAPIALFPLSGGLCNGILCTWFGLSGHTGIVVMFFSVAFVGISIIYCYHFRLVPIAQVVGQDSMESIRHTVFRVAVFIIYTIPCFLLIGLFRNLKSGSLYVKNVRYNNFPSLFYLFEEPGYRAFAYDLSVYPEHTGTVAASTIFIMLFAIVIVGYCVLRALFLLSKQNVLSHKTRLAQRQLLVQLIIQTLIPLTIQLIPLFVYAYSMFAVALDPNITNAIFCFQLSHAFIHTAILILTTPSYREPFIFWRTQKQNDSPPTTRAMPVSRIS